MISFLVACFNEEKNIISTIKEINKTCVFLKIKNYEIIIIDDCSTDNSNRIVKKFTKKYHFVKLLKNSRNLGYGGSIKRAAKFSIKKYIIWVPGDNAHKKGQLIKILRNFKNFDVVSTFYTNTQTRNKFRRIFTETYTPILNFIFGLKLPYFNGVTVIKTIIFNNLNIYTDSHNFSVEMWVKLKLFKKLKIKFVPTLLDERLKGANAFKLKNSIKVVANTFRLILFYYWISFLKNFNLKNK